MNGGGHERGNDEGQSRARRGPAERVGDVLARLLETTGLSRRHDERLQLESWTEIVGERVARFSRPVDLSNGVLTLEADNAVWRQELTLLLPLIAKRFNEIHGEGSVREIRWHHRSTRRRAGDAAR
jgi:predicted nucleic acid-binding Zn ribbon protein